MPDLLLGDSAARARRRSRPRRSRGCRSERDSTSSSSSETRRMARPSFRSSTRRRWTILDRADVEAARRLRGDQHLRDRGRPPGRATTFCWLPPESAAGLRLRPAAAHVELLDQPPRALDEPPREEPAEAASRAARRSRAARCSRRARTRARGPGAAGPPGCARRRRRASRARSRAAASSLPATRDRAALRLRGGR